MKARKYFELITVKERKQNSIKLCNKDMMKII